MQDTCCLHYMQGVHVLHATSNMYMYMCMLMYMLHVQNYIIMYICRHVQESTYNMHMHVYIQVACACTGRRPRVCIVGAVMTI